MGDRTAIACTLGGPERRTLFLLSSTDAYPQRLIGTKTVAPRRGDRRRPGRGAAVSDSYYELVDAGDALGEKFVATDLVRSTWSAAIQHGAPPSALLVRALERCEAARRHPAEPRDDRPARRRSPPRAICGCVANRALRQADRVGQRRDAGPGTRRRAAAGREGQRVAAARRIDTAEVVHAPAPPLRPLSRGPQPRLEEGLGPQLRAQPGLAVADRADERRARRVVDQAGGRPRQG